MITLMGFFKVVSFIVGVVLLINLIKQDSEYNKERDNVNY